MPPIIILDTGPLGMVTHPRAEGTNKEAAEWLRTQLSRGVSVRIPEICDYELRRELIRGEKDEGLRRLEELGHALGYLELTTEVMRTAAQYWADARNAGLPTASDAALDADVILAAQASAAGASGTTVLVATTNVTHLARYCDARHWRDIH